MIIKGTSRAGAAQLGPYLLSGEVNERVEVIEVRGTIAQDVEGAVLEMDAYSEGTKCEKSLYHAQISPEPPYRLTPDQRLQSIDALEKELGLEGHSRVAVIHEKLGREHIHVIWSRIDLEKMIAVSDSHNYLKHETVARQLEREFGHPRVQGAHAERDGHERPNRSPSRSELRQEERTGIKGADVRDEVTALFRASDNADAFRSALEDQGYILARGDRRDFVIVDRAGGTHSLSRRIEGMKAADLREFMKPLARASLPDADTAREIQEDRMQGRPTVFDDIRREDAITKDVLKNELASAVKDRAERADNLRALSWEDRLILAAETKAKLEDEAKRIWDREVRQGRRAARNDAIMEQRYGRSEDYVSQSAAALRDHKTRQRKIDAGPQNPKVHRKKTVGGKFETQSDGITRRSGPENATSEIPNPEVLFGQPSERKDHNEAARSLYRAVNAMIYGEGGYSNSEQARDAAEKAKMISGTKAEANARAKKKEDELLRRQAEETTQRQQAETQPVASKAETSTGSREMSEIKRLRFERFENAASKDEHPRDEDDPDRQREAPGGGRTRSR